MDSGTELLVRKTTARRWVARTVGTLVAVAGIGVITAGQGLAVVGSTLAVTSVYSDNTAADHMEGVTYGPTWGSGPLATFTDSDGAAQPATDYKAQVLWGDGSATTTCPAADCTITASGTPGTFNIAASHAFVDEKLTTAVPSVGHTIHVNVDDKIDAPKTGATGSNAAAHGVSVTDQASAQSSPAFPGFSATAGTAFTGQIGSFQDGNQDAIATDVGLTAKPEYTFSINWGDSTAVDTTSGTFTIDQINVGSAPGTGTGQGCPIFINGTHTYASAGTFTVSIVVKDGTADVLTVTSTATVTGSGGTACTGVTLTPASPINVAAGSTINLNATAAGCSSPQYKYWIGYSNGTWQVLRDWGAAAFVWNTNPAARGHYLIHVWANQVPSSTWEAFAEATVNLTVCASATLTPATVTQPAGSTVALSATSTGCASPLYEFWIGYANGTWQVLRTWGGPTYNWVTNPASAGTYTIHVWANNTGDSQTSWEAYGTESVTLT
jgi:hypothetical protein